MVGVSLEALIRMFVCRRGGRRVGKRPVLRVPDAPVQSHPQPAGALPHESRLRPHRQVVCEAIPEGGEEHQQKVTPASQSRPLGERKRHIISRRPASAGYYESICD